jgi:hypothetical protein
MSVIRNLRGETRNDMRKLGSLLYLALFYTILGIAAISKFNQHDDSTSNSPGNNTNSNNSSTAVTLNEGDVSEMQFGKNAIDTSFYFTHNNVKEEQGLDFTPKEEFSVNAFPVEEVALTNQKQHYVIAK